MPYKDEQRKSDFAASTFPFAENVINETAIYDSGDLNYLFTELIISYLKTNGTNYGTINDIVGALEGAKLEFFRRVAAPYENQKAFDNGDIYEDVAGD